MILHKGNVWTRVVGPTAHEWNWLEQTLAFQEEGAFKRQRESFLSPRTESFPTGLLPLVLDIALSEGIQVDVTDTQPSLALRSPHADLGWLRGYQAEAVRVGLKEERGIFWHATGLGKTEVGLGLALSLDAPALFVSDSADLLEQTAERWERRTGTASGRVGAGSWDRKRFTVCTFQTIAKALNTPKGRDLLRGAQMLIVDECQSLPAGSFYDVAMACSARYRFGLSATPIHAGDRRSLRCIAALGPVISRITPREGYELGHLAWPNVLMIQLEQYSAAGSYGALYRECVVGSGPRNGVISYLAPLVRKPALYLVEQKDHGHNLYHAIGKAGVRVDFVFGDDDQIERSTAVKRLIRNDIDAVVSTRIFQKGKDIPALRTVWRAAAMKTAQGAVQGLGRGSRPDPASGKGDEFDYFDFYDFGHKWLTRHSRMRERAYRREGYDPRVVTLAEAEAYLRQPFLAPTQKSVE